MKTLEQVKNAFDNNEFHMVYMPTISLVDNKCVGAEALIRWTKAGENITPDEFIPTIENTSMSGLLTYWIIEQVQNDLGEWLRSNDNVHIGINVPPEIIGRGGLEYAAIKSGLVEVLDKIVLEITERGFPDKLALETLGTLNGHVKVAIDDFGTGDANMLQLSQLQADIIKLDKHFIDQITDKEKIPKIVKGLVAYAKAMEFEIIAEGVETKIQAEVLNSLGVDMAQGWCFSKPLKPKEFIEFSA